MKVELINLQAVVMLISLASTGSKPGHKTEIFPIIACITMYFGMLFV